LAKEGNRPAKRCVDGHLRRCVLSDQVKELSVISAGAEVGDPRGIPALVDQAGRRLLRLSRKVDPECR
jgi:hypothetical protein